MRARTIVILAVVIFILGGAIGALYAVLSANTPSANEDLPVSTYDELNNDEQNKQDNQDENIENNENENQTDQNEENLNNDEEEDNSQTGLQTNSNEDENQEEHRVGEVNVREDSALSLRQGPGTNYEKIGQVYRGDQLDILEEQNGWYKVQTYDGVEAWVSAEYVNIVGQ